MVVYLTKSRENESAAARELLALAMERELSLSPSDYTLEKDALGKPYLVGAPVSVSIAHSKGAVAVALSENAVGVDIEPVMPIHDRVMKRFVGEGAGCSDDEKTRLWTRYEALSKLIGSGIPMRAEDKKRADECIFHTYRYEKYLVTACTEKDTESRLVVV